MACKRRVRQSRSDIIVLHIRTSLGENDDAYHAVKVLSVRFCNHYRRTGHGGFTGRTRHRLSAYNIMHYFNNIIIADCSGIT